MVGSHCLQCSALKKNGQRCSLNTCVQFPYCWIHLKSIDKLQIKKSTVPNAGKGLFYVGKTDLKPKVRVTLYSSKEITRKDIEGDYVLQVSSKQFLDGKDKSNFVGRYINSMKGTGKQPNVRFGTGYRISKKTVNGETRYTIPIVTIKKIKPNTELLLDYGKDYRL